MKFRRWISWGRFSFIVDGARVEVFFENVLFFVGGFGGGDLATLSSDRMFTDGLHDLKADLESVA